MSAAVRIAEALEELTALLRHHEQPPQRLGLHRAAPVKIGSAAVLLRSIPGLAERFHLVPGEFYRVDGNAVEVDCVCGAHPRLPLDEELVGCSGCERVFLPARDGRLYAARGTNQS